MISGLKSLTCCLVKARTMFAVLLRYKYHQLSNLQDLGFPLQGHVFFNACELILS